MINSNFAVFGFKILGEIIVSIVFFPFWWYSKGLIGFLKSNIDFLTARQKSLGLFVWVKNIFKPMYGQEDWQGKLISFFMRLIQIIVRSVVMFFYLILSFCIILAWIILPFIIMYQIFYQLA
ncbi:hypothetical protein K8R32_03625 [bacterium]|nr:hypothetical protein [bacterium]